MREIQLADVGAKAAKPTEMRQDTLVAYVRAGVPNLNTDLGTPRDPRYSEYQQILDQLTLSQTVTLDSSALQSGVFGQLNLVEPSGKDRSKEYAIAQEFLKTIDATIARANQESFFLTTKSGEPATGWVDANHNIDEDEDGMRYIESNVWADPAGNAHIPNLTVVKAKPAPAKPTLKVVEKPVVKAPAKKK